MTPEDSTDSQLESLRQRWEDDPSPHLSLQLADLYRQRGRLEDALPVLEKGLAEHPGHVSVRVALGRYRLESGDAEVAEEVLLAVVEEDPAHLVANKLLVRTYVALGDLQRAADRLDLYAVLNDSDPEVDTLRATLLDPPPTTGSGEPFGAVAAPPEPAVDLTRVRRPVRRQLRGALGRSPFGDLLTTPLEPLPLADLFEALGETAGELAAAPSAEFAPMLHVDDEISPEFIDALLEQEPAAGAEVEAESEPEAEAEVEAESEPEPEAEVESEPEPEPEPEAEVEVESEPEPEAEAAVEVESESEPEPEAEVEVERESEPEPEAEAEGEAEPEVELESERELEPAPDDAEVITVEAEAPELETELGIVEATEADLPPREVDGGSGATATLGALYLAQDHLDDAEMTFQQVLERDPQDAEARAGLAEVTRRRTAQEEADAPRAAASEQSGRKIELLESYLDRIRRAADRLSA